MISTDDILPSSGPLGRGRAHSGPGRVGQTIAVCGLPGPSIHSATGRRHNTIVCSTPATAI